MAETLSLISIVSFVIAAIFLILAVILFIRFKIPSVIGDLSGRNARKSIEQMRERNEKSGNKSYKPSKVNAERGKLTGTMKGERKESHSTKRDNERPETGLLNENRVKKVSEQQTALLDEEATGILQDDNATEILVNDYEFEKNRTGGIAIEILEEVMIIHSNEIV